ncbi:hypothetical protein, partial [Leclercia adecarboxylata]|uniref:hypothetical protein n=1 Tax=Leclercia adecarboxylata TaxID=83655 RepID=UPI00234D0E83
IPFVLIGLYLVFGRFLLDAWVRRGTRYALTTERVLISRSWPASAFTVIDLDRLPPLVLSEAGDGSGTIRFGTGIASGRGNFASWNPSLDPTPQFLRIAAVRQVFDQLQRAARTVQDR